MTYCSPNRPFPSSPGPLFQNEGRCSAFDFEVIRDGPLEHWWGGEGVGNFQLARIFFLLTACAGIFFWCTPLHEFFFRQILLFFEQWNLDSLSMFLCVINYSTLTDIIRNDGIHFAPPWNVLLVFVRIPTQYDWMVGLWWIRKDICIQYIIKNMPETGIT